jgi:hypothetical protein
LTGIVRTVSRVCQESHLRIFSGHRPARNDSFKATFLNSPTKSQSRLRWHGNDPQCAMSALVRDALQRLSVPFRRRG